MDADSSLFQIVYNDLSTSAGFYRKVLTEISPELESRLDDPAQRSVVVVDSVTASKPRLRSQTQRPEEGRAERHFARLL